MQKIVDLSFNIPIWRFFYAGDNNFTVPYEFMYKNKKYSNSISIIQFGWHIDKNRLLTDKNFLNENEVNKNFRNPILCAATQEQLDLLKKYRPGLRSCLSNHNAFIDETIYKIDNSIEKKYNMCISSSFSNYKNLNLIKNINNVCTIGYITGDTNEDLLKNISHTDCVNFENNIVKKENFKWIHPHQSCEYYNMSKVGGIFSTVEGACFSSSEYLLCGLPVLSCKCFGGREIWYNDTNSVLCENNEESVNKNLKLLVDNYDKGYYNREKIRNDHIELMEVHRNNLTNAILDLLKLITTDIPSFNDLKENIKNYHSNCFSGMDYPSYAKQNLKKQQATDILSGNERNE
jgi:hypothetical protein